MRAKASGTLNIGSVGKWVAPRRHLLLDSMPPDDQ
jgi:hypothetical protein